MRVNLSVAIVAMVNETAIPHANMRSVLLHFSIMIIPCFSNNDECATGMKNNSTNSSGSTEYEFKK
jgi:hypothetical protein